MAPALKELPVWHKFKNQYHSTLSYPRFTIQKQDRKFEESSWKVRKINKRMERRLYEKSLKEFGLFILEKRSLWGDLRIVFKYLRGYY